MWTRRSHSAVKLRLTNLVLSIPYLLHIHTVNFWQGLRLQPSCQLPCLTAENCIVIAEGELDHRGVFRAAALGMPPVESREDSRAATKVLTLCCLRASFTQQGKPCCIHCVSACCIICFPAPSVEDCAGSILLIIACLAENNRCTVIAPMRSIRCVCRAFAASQTACVVYPVCVYPVFVHPTFL